MATKEKAPEAEAAEKPEGATDDAAPKKGFGKILGKLKSKKVLLIGAPVLLVLLLGGGAGAYFFLLKGHDEGEKVAKAEELPLTPPEVAFQEVPDIMVNIQSADGVPAYMKLSVSLEMDNEQEKAGITALTPRLVDQFQSYLRELRIDDLKGAAGVMRLKEELLRRVNASAAPYKVRDVLLKEMIVQ